MSDKRKILCIEDNPVNWRLVQRLLSQAGYDMYWAEEGLQGYQMTVELKPALVLLDINLPGLSGFEVAMKLRQNPDLSSIPIVALTAKTMKSDRETALVAGCDGYISKPIDPFQFTAQVEAYLSGQREKVEQNREGAVLRQFGQQVVEHLEARLKEAQDANRKLQEAQEALEIRNRNLSRLLALSQSIVAEHDPKALLTRILARASEDFGLRTLHVFRNQAGGSYFEGLQWSGNAAESIPSIKGDNPLVSRLKAALAGGPLHGERLVRSPFWDLGLGLGLWTQPSAALLLPMGSRQREGELWGFWALCRDASRPFQPFEAELVALQGDLTQVSVSNAELISNLNESSRALAVSYETLEEAYLNVQQAKAALSQRERQALLGDLFQKMTKALQTPVSILREQSLILAGEPAQGGQEWLHAMSHIRHSVAQIDGLVKALMRRAGKQGSGAPEWIDLRDMLAQEMELMAVEGQFGNRKVEVDVLSGASDGSSDSLIFGVYGDFSETITHMVGHAVGGPTPSSSLYVKARIHEDHFLVEVGDEGGPIPPESLAQAFEPFSGLHEEAVLGVRKPGQGLPSCKQIMDAYRAELSLRNEGEGTVVLLSVPLGQGAE